MNGLDLTLQLCICSDHVYVWEASGIRHGRCNSNTITMSNSVPLLVSGGQAHDVQLVLGVASN